MVVVVDHGAKGNGAAQIPTRPLCVKPSFCWSYRHMEPDVSPLLPLSWLNTVEEDGPCKEGPGNEESQNDKGMVQSSS